MNHDLVIYLFFPRERERLRKGDPSAIETFLSHELNELVEESGFGNMDNKPIYFEGVNEGQNDLYLRNYEIVTIKIELQ